MDIRPLGAFLLLTGIWFLPVHAQESVNQLVAAPGEVYRASFLDKTPQAALQRMDIQVEPEDTIRVFPDPSLGIGYSIEIIRAKKIIISDGDEKRTVRSFARTVEELLEERGVEVGVSDLVEPDMKALIPADGKIAVTRVTETELIKKIAIPITTTTVEDATMLVGTTKTTEPGKAGVEHETYKERRENGKVVERTLLSKEVVTAMVPKVVAKGTKPKPTPMVANPMSSVPSDFTQSGKASFYGTLKFKHEYYAAHLTLPKGTWVTVTNTANGRTVDVEIADRGPYIAGRIIDLSETAFAELASLGTGVINVRIALKK